MGAEWLLWLAIPLVAAAIGYFTNRVAIWMLFRPHSEKRVLGVRIPFTPGLIPNRRLEMAERMGVAVAEHLITEETVGARLESDEVRGAVEGIISAYVDGWLYEELGSLESIIPEELRGEWLELKGRLEKGLREQVGRILRDPGTEAFAREQLTGRLEEWLHRPLGEMVPAGFLEGVPDRVGEWLAQWAEDERFEARVGEFLDERVSAVLENDAPLASYVPERLKSAGYAKMEELIPFLMERISGILEEERLKKRIKVHLYEMADRFLNDTFREDSLWDQVKFGLMEAFVVSTDELKEKIDSVVEDAAPRLAELLQQEDVQKRVHRALTGTVDAFLEKRPSDLNLDSEAVEALKERMARALVDGARSPALRHWITGFVGEQIERYRSRTIAEIFPEASSGELAAAFGDRLIASLREDETVDALAGFASRRIEELTVRPIGPLSDHIPRPDVQKGVQWASDQAIQLLKKEMPRIVRAIDVQGLVRQKVNQLAIGEVEQLILAMTSRQLRAITWFGALLGFVIGLVQVAIVLARGGL